MVDEIDPFVRDLMANNVRAGGRTKLEFLHTSCVFRLLFSLPMSNHFTSAFNQHMKQAQVRAIIEY